MRIIIAILIFSAFAAFGQFIVNTAGGFVIQLDTLRGFFGIGDTTGPTGTPLTINFNYPWERRAGAFIIMIDSVLYSNSTEVSYCPSILLTPYRMGVTAYSDGFATQWSIPMGASGSIILTQRLRGIMVDTLPALKATYHAFNNDDLSHKIAFYQNMDIVVGTNDRAPMAMGGSYSATGQIRTGWGIPYFWQAFENSPGSTHGVVARGILRGIVRQPSVFAFGDERLLYDDCWSPDPAIVDLLYDDSGVSMLWDEAQVSPGKTAEASFIYGFGQSPAPGTDLVLMALVPNTLGSACNAWSTNPFEAALLVYNIGVSPSIDSIQACIHLPVGMSLVIDPMHSTDTCVNLGDLLIDSTAMSAWLIWADTLYYTYETSAEIIVSLTSTTPSVGYRAETTLVQIPSPGGIPPEARLVRAPRHAYSCTGSDVRVKYYISDDEGIDPTTLIVRDGPSVKFWGDPALSWSGDTLTIDIPYYFLIHGNSISHGIIAVSDSDGCIPDSIPLFSSFFVDLLPPFAGPPFPPEVSTVGDSMTPIIIQLFDWPAGIDTMTISATLDIDGDFTYYNIISPELAFLDDSMLIFTPTTPWPDSSQIEFCLVSVGDDVDVSYCPRHYMEDTVCTNFRMIYNSIEETELPQKLSLKVYPNPFNATVAIEAPNAEGIQIFDISGKLVADLSDRIGDKAKHRLVWNGIGDNGNSAPSGVYFVKASRGSEREIKRVMLIK